MARKIQIDLQVEDKGSKEIKKFSKTTNKSFKSIEKSAKRLNSKLKSSLTGLRNSMKSTTKSILSMKTAFVSVAAATGMGYFIKRSIEMADEIAKLADSLGISTAALQEFQFAAKLAGVENTQLLTGMRYLVKGIYDSRSGVGTLVTSLKGNQGLIQQLQDAGSVSEQLTIALDAVRKSSDHSGTSMALFGARSGLAMVNLANSVEKGIKLAKKYGIAIGDNFLRNSEDANDAITLLSAVIKKNLTESVLVLAPYITEIVNKISEWVRVNKDLIKINIKKYLDEFLGVMKSIWDFMKSGGLIGVGIIAGALFGGPIGAGVGGAIGVALTAVINKTKELKGVVTDLNTGLAATKKQSDKTYKQYVESRNKLIKSVIPPTQTENAKIPRKAYDEYIKSTQKVLDLYEEQAVVMENSLSDLEKRRETLQRQTSLPGTAWLAGKTSEQLQNELDDVEKSIDIIDSKFRDNLNTIVKTKEQLKDFKERFAPFIVDESQPTTTATSPEDRLAQRLKEIKNTVELDNAIKNLNKTELDNAAKNIAARKEEIRVYNEILGIKKELLSEGVQAVADSLKEEAALEEASAAKKKDALAKVDEIRKSLADEAKQAQKIWINIGQDIGTTFANVFTDFVTGAKTAREAFSDMAASIGRDLIRISTQMMIFKALGITSGGGLTGGSFFSMIFGAKGGIFPGGFQAFASGGVVSKPTLGMVGEGSQDEAIIPLQHGSVPVALNGATGGINIVNNINIKEVTDPMLSQKQASLIARLIDNRIKTSLVDENRIGGKNRQRRY